MNGDYLIPANSKKGQLLFGMFYPIDLIIFLVGLGITFILLAVLDIDKPVVAVLAILPGMVAGALVLPVAYYHNVRQLIVEMVKYFTQRNRFVWKGWCFRDESSYESKDESKQMDRRLGQYPINH